MNTRQALLASKKQSDRDERLAKMAREIAAGTNWKQANEQISSARLCLEADDWRAAARHFQMAAQALILYADNTEPRQ